MITSTDMTFLNAVHDQDIGRAKENDLEAFMAPGSVQSISNSVDVKFNNDYTESNEAEYNDSDNSNDYSYNKKSVHEYLRIRNLVNINTLLIKSDFVTKNVNQESHISFYEPNTYAEATTLKLFSMFFENNVSCNVFDKYIKIVNKYMAESFGNVTDKLSTDKTCKSNQIEELNMTSPIIDFWECYQQIGH
ncbi:hypothetical protein PHYBLDRAFT_174496 [Phycomyces blakesleeanus NRRL 1555(-)]|uniref:Uncharacterized protein n=1 Tax=Phycomyces blakesleeanus (strain ATCC 8743b / DSM 1359 / FGSC 10004 / NBRC 33097 / NRRL 1555) TaxID=763407 RepID=A0A167K295_PHYB8|nr:hypothetical protein PHYBLDRAFT_174496 [Phycomyces blakesleeanus NRRL 1555(-)]OAD67110.1 hypothetical protein PHYBLDRAFT_174496 [Phycomyces blakesleeanus NRRL 1555(-)]|eukprot:XP_018285150.1 hypothetical protein PHYBLDRAFT_174496 [Phycomyces blakesleeanus NRRL 1555(-)]